MFSIDRKLRLGEFHLGLTVGFQERFFLWSRKGGFRFGAVVFVARWHVRGVACRHPIQHCVAACCFAAADAMPRGKGDSSSAGATPKQQSKASSSSTAPPKTARKQREEQPSALAAPALKKARSSSSSNLQVVPSPAKKATSEAVRSRAEKKFTVAKIGDTVSCKACGASSKDICHL